LFRQALDYITAVGGRQIHVLAGRVPPEQRPAAERVFIANLQRAADLAAEKAITLLIEPINPRDRPDYFLTRAEHAAAIIGELGRPNVRIQFDFYHAQTLAARARRGRGQLSGDIRDARPGRLCGLCGGRVPAARGHCGGAWLGPPVRYYFACHVKNLW
jgi:hydroxypyruvate isomerase